MYTSEEEDDEETLFLIDTALENSRSFAECWNRNNNVEAFLKRDDHLSVRATALKSVVDQEDLCHESDIDGVTIEWLNIGTGLRSDFRHLEILPLGERSFRRFYPVIKKHINLSSFSNNSFIVLKDTVGSQLIYDGIYETWLGFIPDPREWRSIYDFATQSRLVLRFFERLKTRFQEGLKEMFRKGIALDTLAKNNINDVRRMFVLPGHQSYILENFQTALEDTELIELPGFKKVLFTFRFGEKCKTPVELPVRDKNAVKDICVHAGHRISSDIVDLFWSREGVRKVSGGSNFIISSAYSFTECSNMQSALTTSRLAINSDLRAVCTLPQNIRFVQLYNDLPHRYPKARVHPVSASVIMLEGILTDVAQRNLYADASAYLSEIQNNFFQIDRGVCRLEFVVSIGKRSGAVSGTEFIRVDRLEELLEKQPMIVPYLKQARTLKLLRDVGLYLHRSLDQAFRSERGTGNTRLTWDVYQIELAVEKLLWGRPLCSLSNQYSKNLGPGIQYPTRCLTDQKGFLCLEDSSSCCLDDRTLPPMNLFSKNDNIQRLIHSVSGFYNLIGGSQLVLGRRLIEILLGDCHACGKVYFPLEQFVHRLKVNSGVGNKRIVGGITVQDLANMLSTAKLKWHFAFGAVKRLMLKMNVNVVEAIQSGINGLTLGFFPALKTHDANRNVGLNWEYSYGFWVLTDIPDKDSEFEREGAAMRNLVITELDKRGLCHSSKCFDIAFPWLKNVLEKIREKKLPVESKVKVLTFISCVAFLQDGRYVNFYSLNKLERDLPLTQSTLKMLEILSPFLLPGVNNVKIYRLHPSIPFKTDVKSNKTEDTKRPQEPSNVPGRSIQEDRIDLIDPDENEVLVPAATDTNDLRTHVPSHECYKRWSPAELSILANLRENVTLTLAQKYTEYQKACRSLHLPDRSFDSFRRKLRRLT